jgi:AcrR family transcriptional regulator
MARTPRKETQLDHVRQEILRAAARAAAQTGLGAVTMRDIAKEAGYTVGTLYTYFDNKEAIESGLMKQLSDLIFGVLEVPVPAGLSFRQKLELVVLRQLTIAEDWREGIFAVMTALPGLAASFKQNTTSDVIHGFAKWLKTNAKSSELGGREPLEVSLFYFSVLEVVVTAAMQRKFSGAFVELLPRVTDLLFNGIGGTRTVAKAKT